MYSSPNVSAPWQCKIVVLGDSLVGKSALVISYAMAYFMQEPLDPDIEDSYRKAVTIDNWTGLFDILDAGGNLLNPERRTAFDAYVRTGDAFLLVFSITNRKSLITLRQYMARVLSARECKWIPGVIVGTKHDLADKQREVPAALGKRVAHSLGLAYFETSAKTRDGVEEAFTEAYRCWRRGPPQHLRSAPKSRGKKKNRSSTEQCSTM